MHVADRQLRLQRVGIAPREPAERPQGSRLASLGQHALRHRAVRKLGIARLVEPGEQVPRIAIAEPRLVPRRRAEPGDRRFGHAAGAIAAAREPHGAEAGIVRHLDQSRRPLCVSTGEMIVAEEALRVEEDLHLRESTRRDLGHARRRLFAEA